MKRIVILYARNNKSARITQVQPLLNLADKEGIEVIEVVVEDASRAGSEIVEKLKNPFLEQKKVRQFSAEKTRIHQFSAMPMCFLETTSIKRVS